MVRPRKGWAVEAGCNTSRGLQRGGCRVIRRVGGIPSLRHRLIEYSPLVGAKSTEKGWIDGAGLSLFSQARWPNQGARSDHLAPHKHKTRKLCNAAGCGDH